MAGSSAPKTAHRHPVPLILFLYSGLTILILHFLPTGFTLNQAVSDYALSPYGIWLDVAFFANGVALILLANLIIHVKKPVGPGLVGIISMAVAGISFFAIGVFTTDIEGTTPPTTHGILHLSFSFVIFVSLIVATVTLSRFFKSSTTLSPFYKSSIALALVYSALFALTLVTLGLGYVGIGERAAVAALYAWMLLTSYRMFKISRW